MQDGLGRSSIIDTLSNVPSEQRTQRYERLVEFRDRRADHENTPLNIQQIINGLETPLNQPLLLDANGMQQLAAQGAIAINVHKMNVINGHLRRYNNYGRLTDL